MRNGGFWGLGRSRALADVLPTVFIENIYPVFARGRGPSDPNSEGVVPEPECPILYGIIRN